MKTALLLCTVCFGGLAFAQGGGGSLWSDMNGPLLGDVKAHAVGDVLTVVITETSSASSTAATKTSKTESGSLDAGVGPILSKLLPKLSATGKQSDDASGSTTRAGSLSARMSVVVKQVLANGTLVIEGKRDVMVNKEVQKLVLSGIVRTKDVAQDNTIPSFLIANAEIQYEGKGPVGDKQREGIITKLFKTIFGGIF